MSELTNKKSQTVQDREQLILSFARDPVLQAVIKSLIATMPRTPDALYELARSCDIARTSALLARGAPLDIVDVYDCMKKVTWSFWRMTGGEMTTNKWATPVSSVGVLPFEEDVIGKYLPEMKEIPDEFKSFHNKYVEFVSKWFFEGLEDVKFDAKEGVDVKDAFRQIKICLGSFQPQHEHKEYGAAYLVSLFFDKVSLGGKQVLP